MTVELNITFNIVDIRAGASIILFKGSDTLLSSFHGVSRVFKYYRSKNIIIYLPI